MADKKISAAVIKRLPRYYRYLSELLDNGIERISSGELSKQMKVTASQIRQDFNNFGGFGQQGYGYNVPYLKNEIGKILGLDRDYHVIILGAGNLGHALANYAGYEKRGFVVSAVIDLSPHKIGKKILQHLRCRNQLHRQWRNSLYSMVLVHFGILRPPI